VPWVAGCGGQVLAADLQAADLFEHGEHLVHSDSTAAPEVEDLADHVSGGSLDGALDRVGNVREVACLLAITEDFDVLSRGERLPWIFPISTSPISPTT